MKEIHLTQGKIALVDDDDYEWIAAFKWHAVEDRNTFYAMKNVKINGTWVGQVSMHRGILGLVKGDGKIGDHKNQNGLDNRKTNLRIANTNLNKYNCKQYKNNHSGFRGVSFTERDKVWRSHIGINGKRRYLGSFQTRRGAALSYDNAAIKQWGENAILNFPNRKEI